MKNEKPTSENNSENSLETNFPCFSVFHKLEYLGISIHLVFIISLYFKFNFHEFINEIIYNNIIK